MVICLSCHSGMACLQYFSAVLKVQPLAAVLMFLKCPFFGYLIFIKYLFIIIIIYLFIVSRFTLIYLIKFHSPLSYHSFYSSRTAVGAVESSQFLNHFSQTSFLNLTMFHAGYGPSTVL